METDFDVIIVGASIAGATVAALLAKRGVNVALIDCATFPRRKPCGEGLSSLAFPVLREAGVMSKICSAAHAPLTRYTIRDGSRTVEIPQHTIFGRNTDPSIGIERFVLDQIILENATQYPNVTAYFGEKPEIDGLTSAEPPRARVRLGKRVLNASYLVIADGAVSAAATQLDIIAVRSEKLRYGMSLIAEGKYRTPIDTVTIVTHHGGNVPELSAGFELFFTPVAKNRLNIAVLSDRATTKAAFTPSPDELLKLAYAHIGFLGEVAREPLSCGPVCHQKRKVVLRETVFLVGDAAETFDPIGGMGMTHALTSASLCSRAVLSALYCDELPHVSPSEWYALEHDNRSRRLKLITATSYFALKNRVGRALSRTLLRPWTTIDHLPLLTGSSSSPIAPD